MGLTFFFDGQLSFRSTRLLRVHDDRDGDDHDHDHHEHQHILSPSCWNVASLDRALSLNGLDKYIANVWKKYMRRWSGVRVDAAQLLCNHGGPDCHLPEIIRLDDRHEYATGGRAQGERASCSGTSPSGCRC